MKKTICVLLMMILMATGCASQEIQEEQSTKLEQEETVKEEISQDLPEEDNEKEISSKNDDTIKKPVSPMKKDIVKGQITLQGTDPGLGVLLEKRVSIGPYEVKQLVFNEKETVLNYIPRSALTYYFEGDLSLKEELTGQLDLEIKIDPSTIYYEEERDLAWVDVIEVISLDGEINPRDKTKDSYPDQYYKDVIRNLCASMNIPIRDNIQDTEVYLAGGVFTEAVDELLYRGYSITMDEDRYHIDQ